jgi:hypothetical protein
MHASPRRKINKSEVHAPRAANQIFVKVALSGNNHFFRAKCPGPRVVSEI